MGRSEIVMVVSRRTYCAAALAVVWISLALGSREVHELTETDAEMQDLAVRFLQDPPAATQEAKGAPAEAAAEKDAAKTEAQEQEENQPQAKGKEFSLAAHEKGELQKKQEKVELARVAGVTLWRLAAAHALQQIKLGKVKILDPVIGAELEMQKATNQAQKDEKVRNGIEAEEEKPSIAKKLEVKKAKQEAVVRLEKKKAETESEDIALDAEIANGGKNVVVTEAKASEKAAEAAEKKSESAAEAPSAELGEGGDVGKETVEQCHEASIAAIKTAMVEYKKSLEHMTPGAKALAALQVESDIKDKKKNELSPEARAAAVAMEATEKANKATNPMEKEVAKVEQAAAEKVAAEAVAKAKTPLAEKKAEIEQVVAERKAQVVATDANLANGEKKLIKKTEEVQAAKGTIQKAKASVKAVKAAEKVEKETEKGVAEKAKAESAAVKDAKETAEQTKPADAKLMAKQTEKVVKKVEKGTPQSEEVAAIQAVDAAKKVKKDIFHTAQPAKIAKDEKKAVVAAKKVPKALASAAVAVGEVKAEEAAEKVEEKPSKKNEKALVAKAKDLTKIKSAKKLDAPEVKAVEVTRAIDAKKEAVKEEAKQVVTDEEKKLVKGAQSLVVQKVLDAEKTAEKAEPKLIKPNTKTTDEIRKEIQPKKSIKQEAKKVGLRKAVAAMARSGGKVGNALAQILEAPGKDPKKNAQGNLMSQAEQVSAAREMKKDVK